MEAPSEVVDEPAVPGEEPGEEGVLVGDDSEEGGGRRRGSGGGGGGGRRLEAGGRGGGAEGEGGEAEGEGGGEGVEAGRVRPSGDLSLGAAGAGAVAGDRRPTVSLGTEGQDVDEEAGEGGGACGR